MKYKKTSKKLSPPVHKYTKWYTTTKFTHPAGKNSFSEPWQPFIWDALILTVLVIYFTCLGTPHASVLRKLSKDMVKDKLLISLDPLIVWASDSYI